MVYHTYIYTVIHTLHIITFLTESAAVTFLVVGELSSSLATLSYNKTLQLYVRISEPYHC